MKRSAIGLVLCLASANVTQAQHPLVLQRLEQINAAAPPPSPQVISALIAKTAKTVYADKPNCASTGLTLDEPLPATAERQVFFGAVRGQIRNGWTVMARHPVCDEVPVRYMLVQDGSGGLRSFRVNRGRSHAHESLISDTFPLATLAAEAFLTRAKLPCPEPKKPQLGVTRIAEEDGDLGPDKFGVRYKGSWTEIWPVAICGETLDVTVRFTADGDGGAYTNLKGDAIKRTTAPPR